MQDATKLSCYLVWLSSPPTMNETSAVRGFLRMFFFSFFFFTVVAQAALGHR